MPELKCRCELTPLVDTMRAVGDRIHLMIRAELTTTSRQENLMLKMRRVEHGHDGTARNAQGCFANRRWMVSLLPGA
jgi:hypothetical protein